MNDKLITEVGDLFAAPEFLGFYRIYQSNEVQNHLRLSASICVPLLLLVPHLNSSFFSSSDNIYSNSKIRQ